MKEYNVKNKRNAIRSIVLIFTLMFATATAMVAQKETPARNFKYIIEDNAVTITGWKDWKGKIHDITVPAFISGKPVKKIGNDAFLAMLMHTIILPNNIAVIGEEAFRGCRFLKEITLPNSITEVGKGAFMECGSLTKIVLSNSLTGIEDNTFRKCKALTEITIPNNVTKIGKESFRGCGLTKVTFSNRLTEIGELAFSGCSLTEVILPNSVDIIGDNAFLMNKITSLTFPENLTKIGLDAFDSNPLKLIKIPQSFKDKELNNFDTRFNGWYTLYNRQSGTYTYEDGKWFLDDKDPPPYGIIIAETFVIISAITMDDKKIDQYDKYTIGNKKYLLPAGKYSIGVTYQNLGDSFSDTVMYYEVDLAAGKTKKIIPVISGNKIGYSIQDE